MMQPHLGSYGIQSTIPLNLQFEPDPVIQAIVLSYSRPSLCPEQRLALAVLEDAIECAWGLVSANNNSSITLKQIAQDARQWIKSDSDEGMSFQMVCSLLDIDPGYLRRGIEERVFRRAA